MNRQKSWKRLTASATVFFIAAAWSLSPSAALGSNSFEPKTETASDAIDTGIREISDRIAAAVSKLGSKKVKVDSFRPNDSLGNGLGNRICDTITAALAEKNIEVSAKKGDYIVRGEYYINKEKSGSNQKSVVVEWFLKPVGGKGKSKDVQNVEYLEGTFTINDINELINAATPTTDLPVVPAGDTEGTVARKILDSVDPEKENKKFFLSGKDGAETRVSASAESRFAMEIRVDNKPLPVTGSEGGTNGEAFVDIPAGKPFTIVLYDLSKFHAFASLRIDGISVFKFSKQKPPGGGEFNVFAIKKEEDRENPLGTLITGWYGDQTSAKEFIVGDFARSAAGKLGIADDDSDVGTISAVFGFAYDPGEPKAADEPSSKGMPPDTREAVMAGNDVKTNYKMVTRENGVIRSAVTIRYRKKCEKKVEKVAEKPQ